MINVTPDIIKALQQTGLKVYNEYLVTSKTEVPCITYREYDNRSTEEVDEFGYSDIVYHIKIWAKSQKELVSYSAQIDSIMRVKGFKRTSSTDLWTTQIGQRDMKFKALAFEKF